MDTVRGFRKDEEKHSDRLFASHYRSNSSTQLKASCRKRRIPPFTMHGLRSLRVDTLQRQGIEPAVYEQIIGRSMIYGEGAGGLGRLSRSGLYSMW